MLACENGRDSAAMKLLERDDIQVNLQNVNGYTALMLACRYRQDSATIKLLEREDTRVNLTNTGETALIFAC
jgi:ankyrin repeat protein